MSDKDQQDAWLARPESIRLLWIVFSVALMITLVLQFITDLNGDFGIGGWLGFAAIFGFGSCLLMVLVARVLGFILKRDQAYYREESDD